ncbi:tetratricopeptide repeat protein [Vibrio quintilis]|uniref:Uncharacterized protein n=1 Tax=Vibrio quintilis TaxID=1117707 RepID=A0A1M7YW98_9VIBR|nr:HEAT repeat domain-containing protein [Vibrio quintilis]SHO56904.1 hypothetical protein VQ7734_02673 [Vibrio quintilis]
MLNNRFALSGTLTALILQLLAAAEFIFSGVAVTWLLLYVISAIVFGVSCLYLLPVRYRRFPAYAFLFLFIFAVSLPVLGIVGCLIAVVAGVHYPLEKQQDVLEEHLVPELPFEPDQISLTPRYSRGGVAAILKYARDVDKRLFAVVTTRNMEDREAIPILKQALKDTDDDIRLLAYSSLDKKETAINDDIHVLKKQLAGQFISSFTGTASCHHQIARKYWELSYLGLAQGALRQYVLEKAAFHAGQSLMYEPAVTTEILLAKIWLMMGRYEQAQTLFEKAAQSGVPVRQTYPYLAEIAYKTKQYQQCRIYMGHLEGQKLSLNLDKIRSYWHDDAL